MGMRGSGGRDGERSELEKEYMVINYYCGSSITVISVFADNTLLFDRGGGLERDQFECRDFKTWVLSPESTWDSQIVWSTSANTDMVD